METELRIGNYVLPWHGNEQNYIEVGFVTFLLMSRGETPKPISLTEEWLLRFGFENKGIFINKIALLGEPKGDMDGATLFQIGEYGQEVYLLNGKFYFQIDMHDDDYGTSITTKEIPFVHKLQNLFFELRDEELTIK